MQRVVFMRHDRHWLDGRIVVERPYFHPEADVPALGGIDEGAFIFALEQDVTGVEVA